MILRRATQADVSGLARCIDTAYAPFMHLGLPEVSAGLADDITHHHVWIAEVAGEVCGGVVLVLGETAHLTNLAVDPVACGKGVGRSLVDQACAAAHAAGYAEIGLATHRGMTATQAFYKSSGWTETGRSGEKVYFKRKL
jgi:N-acetylglutamate synthase-like GNAT family acetyltransferase